MAILVTGAAGFIASNLCDRLLELDKNVIAIDNFNANYDPALKESNISKAILNKNYKLYRCDVCEQKNLDEIFSSNKIDTVIHLAAYAGVRDSMMHPELYIKNNISATLNILQTMHKHNVNKIIFASTSSIYGNSAAKKFKETQKTDKLLSVYAVTKSDCEKILYTYSHLCGINAICLRLFTVFGPRQRPDLAIKKFCTKIINNKAVELYGNGTSSRDYTYIDDATNAFICALDYNETGYEIINIGSSHRITLKYMVKTIEDTLNKKAQIIYLPFQKCDMKSTCADISKAQKLLHWTPKTSFKEGVKKFIDNEFKKQ